jgi:hypothetical protein
MKRALCVAGIVLSSYAAFAGAPAAAASWSLQRMARAPGAASTDPLAVSCPAAGSCIAVGTSLVRVNPQLLDNEPLAEEWHGGRWTVSSVPLPSGATPTSTQLFGVSCISAERCFAVGTYAGGPLGIPMPLIERWNGHDWHVQNAPHPDGTQDSQLNGVSCMAADSCLAVGYDDPLSPGSFRRQLVERWNGHAWSIQQAPSFDTNAALQSISCHRSGCVAVGEQGAPDAPFAERYQSGSWSVLATALAADTSFSMQLDSVSCSTMSSCTAVGGTRSMIFNDRFSHVVEGWDGARWSLESVPVPSAERFANQLASVSCAGSVACVAVGWSGRLSHSLILRRDGAGWVLQPAPAPASDPRHGAILAGVSCSAANACTAVGSYAGENGGLPYAERYSSAG